MEIHLDPRVEVHTRGDRLSLAWRRLLADWRDPIAGPAADGVSEALVELETTTRS